MYVALCIKMRKNKSGLLADKAIECLCKVFVLFKYWNYEDDKTFVKKYIYIKLLRFLVENFSWPNFVCVTLYSINQWQDTTLVYVTITGGSVRYQVCIATYTVFFIFISNPNSWHITVLLSLIYPRISCRNSGIISWNL